MPPSRTSQRRVQTVAKYAAKHGSGENLSEYEQLRLRNIQRNREMKALGIDEEQARIKEARLAESQRASKNRPQQSSRKRRASSKIRENLPLRRSTRRRSTVKRDDVVDSATLDLPNKPEEEALVDAREYWASLGVVPDVETDGHFSGWVKEDVRKRLGIAGSAADAWNAHGGGRFSYCKKSRVSAKENARSMLHKNPNAYFYRHCEPGVEQWFGDWTDDETELFIKTAKAYGCGDKWGLFSTYIPHRVGYQCSQHYRAAIVGEGVAVDPSFKISKASGQPVYVGSRFGKRGSRK